MLASRDLRLALRGLTRHPVFAAAAVLTIGLAIAADVAVLSVVNGSLFRPLPYRDPDRLVMVWTAFPAQRNPKFSISPAELLDYREQSRSYASMGAWGVTAATLTGNGPAERRRVGIATAGLFDTVGAKVALGRLFTAEEDAPGGPSVALLSHPLWASRFGGDPGVADGSHALRVDGESLPIVGVLDPGFELPGGVPDFFVPAHLDRARYTDRSGHNLNAMARLRPGVTLASARAELARMLPRWATEYAGQHANDPVDHPLFLESLDEELFGALRPTLAALLAAVGLVLLLAAANVANLLLARGFSRRREMGIRGALGATAGELLRQLLVESLAIASLGGVVGMGLGWGAIRLLALLDSGGGAPVAAGVDGRVVVATVVATLAAGLLFGALPALQAAGWEPRSALADGGRGASGGRALRRSMRGLVVVQMSLAVVLLVGSGLLLKSLLHLQAVRPGFEAAERVGFSLQLAPNRYPERQDRVAFYDRLTAALEALPGVRRSALARGLPMRRWVGTEGFTVDGRTLGPDEAAPSVDLQFTSPGYFRTMGIPVVEGREVEAADRVDAPLVALINETAARAYFPGESPLGRRLHLLFAEDDWPPVTVVGVVGDVRQRGLAPPPRPELYLPPAQMPSGWALGLLEAPQVVVETSLPLAALSPAIRRAVAELDPEVPVSDLQPMRQAVAASSDRERFLSLLLAVFAALAVTIAGVGVYAVMAYSVRLRGREIAIRLAVGARPVDVLGSVCRESLRLAAVGGALGLGAAALAAPAIAGLLYETGPRDLGVYAGSVALLSGVAVAAALLPARRAAATDPLASLTAE